MLWFYNICTGGHSWAFLNFNTSHVMVLLISQFVDVTHIKGFQYISCYGSIMDSALLAHWACRFQYISCYGSIDEIGEDINDFMIISIHLMLWFY